MKHRNLWGPIVGWAFTSPKGWATTLAVGVVMWTPPGFVLGMTAGAIVTLAERIPPCR